MMADVQTIYERAIYILGAEDEGFVADSAKNRDYKSRTLAIINTLLYSLYPRLEELDARKEGVRPLAAPVTAFTDEIGLNEGAACAILPLGLAGHLVLEENPAVAGYLLGSFETEAARFIRFAPAVPADIEDVYGGIPNGGGT